MTFETILLLLVSGLLGAIIVTAITSSYQHTARNNHKSTDNRYTKWPIRVYYSIKKRSHDYRAKRRAKQAKEPANWSLVRATHILSVFTLGLIAVGISQCRILGGQQDVLKGTLDVLRDQNRPWIRANISIARPIRFTDWDNSKFVSISLNFDLKNFGDIPARNIRIAISVSPHPGNDKKRQLDNSEDIACKHAKEMADFDKIGGRI